MVFPLPAEDYTGERISLEKEIIQHSHSTFFARMEGDSMVNAFIAPGALLVIDSSREPQNMDLVLATVKGKFTVRYLKKNDFKAWLVPANSKMRAQLIVPEMEVRFLGVIISIVTDPRMVPCVRMGGL
ncbi:MAG: S24 family peptidase [Bacteroidota bacterium]|nr:S24 family peptidase [Bacteroidota bacterium]MDP4252204.1 S24 family peptidase [Bacteroidota bacterium]